MSNAKPPRPLATREEVAGYLGITTKALDQWRRQGKGPKAYSIGRAVRYRWDEVEQWVVDQGDPLLDEPEGEPEPGNEAQCPARGQRCDHVWCWECRTWRRDTGDPDTLNCLHPRALRRSAA
jgi:predicted DNA-binding transcriptional regulator AlpA